MAGFDEAALRRLEELVAKSKGGSKLPAPEALELKELKLLRQTAEIATRRASIAVAKRKIEDREKYRVGGLAVGAGLSRWNDDELKGGFAMLAELADTARSELGAKGKQASVAEAAKTVLVPLRVSFGEAPDEAVLTALKKTRFQMERGGQGLGRHRRANRYPKRGRTWRRIGRAVAAGATGISPCQS